MADYTQVTKFGAVLPISDVLLAEAVEMQRAMDRWTNSTPQERAQWRAEAAIQRAGERTAVEPVPLTLDTLLAALGIDRAYATHLVQPYCECTPDGGWDRCVHAADLGVGP